jgi:nucleoid-associated protein YgaU
MMERWGRVFVGLSALAGLWIVVYWWWEPRGAKITFDDGSPVPRTLKLSEQVPPPAVELSRLADQSVDSRATSRMSSLNVKSDTVVPPKFRDYTVKPGDTLAGIAKRELGSERYAEAIARSNPFKDTEKLKAGRVLRLPLDPQNIQGKKVAASEASVPPAKSPGIDSLASRITSARATGSDPPARISEPEKKVVSVPVPIAAPLAKATQPPAEEYTVKSGDTLSKISQAHYGSTAMASSIAKFNGLSDPDSLRLGQKLRLPPKGE